MMQRCAAFLLLASFLFTPLLHKRITEGFRLGKLALDLHYNPAWDSGPPSVEQKELARSIFSRPLRYLSHGAQSFVFATEGGDYIVKFFRYDQRVHPMRRWLRDEVIRKRKRLRHQEKIHRLFTSVKLAYERASDLTGLVYIHLNETNGELPQATLLAPLGRRYTLPMDRYRFVIQRRGQPFRDVVRAAIDQGDGPLVERLLRSFVSLIAERTKREIVNTDTKVAPNFGFIGEQAVEWDCGNYLLDSKLVDPAYRRREAVQFYDQVRHYLVRHGPEYVPFFEQLIAQNGF